MTGCVHRRVIIEDLNRKASSAIGKFFIVFAIIWIGFAAFKALFLASQHTASLLRPSAAAYPAEHPCRPFSASGAPLRPSRPAEHPCTGSLGQRSTSPALTASGAPLQRPAEHLSGPLGQRSTSPALTASGAPCTGPLGQRSTSPALTASGAPLQATAWPAKRL
ncbi:uncharacterized protein LOC132792820 [Drosophila nasuta]|uniref:uncharacterized protein LOC132792820 n=1 Tax=Drosophila nasuta TaxID=42062 RepID=UPI00295EB5DD|nr:uncharacterized protein LOC132792820 [Drosophila nasuta]